MFIPTAYDHSQPCRFNPMRNESNQASKRTNSLSLQYKLVRPIITMCIYSAIIAPHPNPAISGDSLANAWDAFFVPHHLHNRPSSPFSLSHLRQFYTYAKTRTCNPQTASYKPSAPSAGYPSGHGRCFPVRTMRGSWLGRGMIGFVLIRSMGISPVCFIFISDLMGIGGRKSWQEYTRLADAWSCGGYCCHWG